MRNYIIGAAVVAGVISGLTLWGQRPTNNQKRPLPDFDVRDTPTRVDAVAEQRQARLALFASSADESRLGTRITANRYGLPKVYLRDSHSLTSASALKPAEIAKDFLRSHADIFYLKNSEIDGLRLLVDDASDNARFVAFNQTIGGIDVYNAQIKFTLNKDGEVIQVATGDIVAGVDVSINPRLTVEDAVKSAFLNAGAELTRSLSRSSTNDAKTAFANPLGNGFRPITAELTILPTSASSARLAYRIFLEVDTRSWYELLIDAESGALLFRHNLYVFSAQARVWTESPSSGTRTLVTFPDGWISPTATTTTGNNVDAYLDADGNDRPDNTTDPNLNNARAFSATQVFDFPFGDGLQQMNPRLFRPAAVTNLFYFVNIAHDYYYGLGFNEAAGNFQTDNLGRGGVGNDAIQAEAQQAGALNNAAFASTPEGTAPKLRVGLVTRGTSILTDDLDSDYDGPTIIHEYGHGLSNRLVGAKISTTCLQQIQSKALGEGWSDYFAISYFNNPVFSAYPDQDFAKGPRRYSYENYPLTYEDIGNGTHGYEEHDDGEIWAGTLWDIRKTLGQSVTDRLVVDGLKSTPCNPAMTTARDAIISADQATHNGDNRLALWGVFARHGLGYSAVGVDGTPVTGTRYDAAYDLPPDLQSTPAPNPLITSNPLSIHPGSGDLYNYKIVASNPAGGTLSYVLSKGPANMVVDASGNVTWPATFTSQRVKITVTDGRGGKVVHGYLLPVLTFLTSGNSRSIAGEPDSDGFAIITVAAGTPVLQITLRGGTGDADLYIGSPDGLLFVSGREGNTETLSFANPRAGQWVIDVFAYEAYSQVALTATQITPTLVSSDNTLSGLSAVISSEAFYRFTVPAGVSSLTVSTTGGLGDIDIFLRRGAPAVCQSTFAVVAPCVADLASEQDGNAETIAVTNPPAGDWYLDLHGFDSYFGVTLKITTTLTLTSGGVGRFSTAGLSPALSTGYATATATGGATPYGTAVFSLSQNGFIVSEAGVPASPPTQSARIFIDYRTGVPAGNGTIDVNTGLAIAYPGAGTASLTYTLRDSNGQTLATGHGTLAAGNHRAKFIHELKDIAPDFILPANFSTAVLYGSLEITSNQPVSVLALRLTINQRGDILMTSTPVADLSRPQTTSLLYFPQLADGGGFTTFVALLNTSSSTEAGSIAAFDDSGAAVSIRPVGGTASSTFSYSIPPSGFFILRTDGSPSATQVGWIRVTPNTGNNSPIGAGVFSYSPQGILITESGVPSAVPTTSARLFIDKSNGHDTGIAIASPAASTNGIAVKAFQSDGTTPAGSGPATVSLASNGHKAAFAGEIVSGLPPGFTGVMELTSPTPFVALTLRSLANGRGDTLLTTFPVADSTQPAPAPMIFPQIADGGGFSTQFIFISATGAATVSVSLAGDDGSALSIPRAQ